MTASTPWREAFEGFAARLPDDERRRRRAHFDRFARTGFPTRDEEDFKYTDLSALGERRFAPASPSAGSAIDIASLLLAETDRMVFVDGVLRPELGTRAPDAAADAVEPEAPDAIASLHGAFSTEGAQLHLARGKALQRPLHVLLVTTTAADGRMSHLSHRLRLDEGAEAQVLIEHVDLGSATHLSTHRLDVRVGPNAVLHLARLQREGAGTSHLFRGEATLARDARLRVCNVDLGGGLVRNDWIADLAEPGAEVRLDGVYAPAGATHVDNHTRIDHRAPRCTSREFFRGLALDGGRAVFNGKIVVHPGAQKTDSEQRVANLLLSPKAEINAKPELEIYADDVKCAHGATFGQLDRAALFYLRTRGIPEDQARALLTLAFAQTPLAEIVDPGVRRHLADAVARHLGGDAALEAPE